MNQPPLSPPARLFPVAWTILYILMGIACFLVWIHPVNRQVTAKEKTFERNNPSRYAMEDYFVDLWWLALRAKFRILSEMSKLQTSFMLQI